MALCKASQGALLFRPCEFTWGALPPRLPADGLSRHFCSFEGFRHTKPGQVDLFLFFCVIHGFVVYTRIS